jgi:hypothetical protein
MESSDGQTYQNQLQHDQSHYDLGRRRLGRNLAYALSLRRERFDYVAVASHDVSAGCDCMGTSAMQTQWSIKLCAETKREIQVRDASQQRFHYRLMFAVLMMGAQRAISSLTSVASASCPRLALSGM